MSPVSMDEYMERNRNAGALPVTQPRMGFGDLGSMRHGLLSVKALNLPRVGTITLDAKTRQLQFKEASDALKAGMQLNGFPIVSHGAEVTHAMLDGVQDHDFPVQIRHGSPIPNEVFKVSAQAGITAIEGGPISYCFPYGRVPFADCIRAWDSATRFWAESGRIRGITNHLETFGGCMMGQLNPPDLLAAISILEALFFAERGIRSLSLSHSQGTNLAQDIGALLALRKLSRDYLPADVRWHIVLYTWMGVFPQTPQGARRLIEDSGILAAITKTERIIVKTVVEAFQIPTVEDNIRALWWTSESAALASGLEPHAPALEHADTIYRHAKSIIDSVLNLAPSLDEGMLKAFRTGVLDIPFCFHPDNRNEARALLNLHTGILGWERPGHIPIPKSLTSRRSSTLTSNSLLQNLTFNQRKYDGEYL